MPVKLFLGPKRGRTMLAAGTYPGISGKRRAGKRDDRESKHHCNGGTHNFTTSSHEQASKRCET